MNNSGKLALAKAIVTALEGLTPEAKADLIFTSFLELETAVRKNAATSIALAEESLALGNRSVEIGLALSRITKANGAPVLAIVEALAGLEDAARAAARSLDGRELFGMGEERIAAILAMREALARLDLARHEPATPTDGGDHAAAH